MYDALMQWGFVFHVNLRWWWEDSCLDNAVPLRFLCLATQMVCVWGEEMAKAKKRKEGSGNIGE